MVWCCDRGFSGRNLIAGTIGWVSNTLHPHRAVPEATLGSSVFCREHLFLLQSFCNPSMAERVFLSYDDENPSAEDERLAMPLTY